MKINLPKGVVGRGGKIPQGSTVISPNLVRHKDYIDAQGNHWTSADPKTRQLIRKADKE